MSKFEHDGLFYETISSTEVKIIGAVDKDIEQLTCPSIVRGHMVTQIGQSAFRHCENLKLLYLSDKINRICGRAFSDCKNLRSIIQVPNAPAVSIFENAFANCISLTKVYMDIRSVGMYAFENCTKLKAILLTPTCTNISTKAFYNCCALADVTLSGLYVNDPTLYMYDDAFAGCPIKYFYSGRNIKVESATCLHEANIEEMFPETVNIMCTGSSNMNDFIFHGYSVMEWKT